MIYLFCVNNTAPRLIRLPNKTRKIALLAHAVVCNEKFCKMHALLAHDFVTSIAKEGTWKVIIYQYHKYNKNRLPRTTINNLIYVNPAAQSLPSILRWIQL